MQARACRRRGTGHTATCALVISLLALGCVGRGEAERADTARRWGLAGMSVPVLVQGNGPVVVLVNGGSMDLRQWDDVAARLDDRRTVVRFDLPGWGAAPEPRTPYDPLEVMAALLSRVGVERADFVGFSYGASLVLDLALERPELVRSCALLSPSVRGYPWSADAAARDSELRDVFAAGGAEALIDAMLDDPTFAPTAADDADLRARIAGLMSDSAELLKLDQSLVQHPATPTWLRLEQLDLPVLLVLFEHAREELLALGQGLTERVPGLRVVGVKGVGHLGVLEDPEALAGVLGPFLDDPEPASPSPP